MATINYTPLRSFMAKMKQVTVDSQSVYSRLFEEFAVEALW